MRNETHSAVFIFNRARVVRGAELRLPRAVFTDRLMQSATGQQTL
jgi:hypothetical protein